jgi:hypothetical protein
MISVIDGLGANQTATNQQIHMGKQGDIKFEARFTTLSITNGMVTIVCVPFLKGCGKATIQK